MAALGATAIFLATSVGADPSNEPAEFARKGVLRIAAGQPLAPPPLPRLVAARLVGPGQPVGGSPLAPGDEILTIAGSLVPVAVSSRDASLVAFSSWRQLARIDPDRPGQGVAQGEPVGVPSIRVFDTAAMRARVVARGAHSPALSLDDRLAFFRANEDVLRSGVPYEGHVYVGPASDDGFQRWTDEPARYFAYAWAGDTLLVYRALPGSEATDLYAYTSPGEARLVASQAFVIALSPDGRRVLVTSGRRMVQIVRVADGAIEASLPLDGGGVAAPDSDTTPHTLMYSGSWREDRVVANSDRGLVVLDVAGGIRVASVLETPAFPHGIVEPRFVDETHVVGWADLAGGARPQGRRGEPAWDHALVHCDLEARTCAVGEAQPARAWTRWIDNPSR